MTRRLNRRGDPSGEWRKRERPGAAEPAPPADADASTVAAPGAARSPAARGSDPYNQDEDAPPAGPARRRSLDDMRRLSEAIKTAPNWTRPGKSGSAALYKRLDAMRAELQRTLDEINSLRAGAARDASHNVRELMVLLRDAAHHLGEAINSLVPPGN
jgi:hypothetical protein